MKRSSWKTVCKKTWVIERLLKTSNARSGYVRFAEPLLETNLRKEKTTDSHNNLPWSSSVSSSGSSSSISNPETVSILSPEPRRAARARQGVSFTAGRGVVPSADLTPYERAHSHQTRTLSSPWKGLQSGQTRLQRHLVGQKDRQARVRRAEGLRSAPHRPRFFKTPFVQRLASFRNSWCFDVKSDQRKKLLHRWWLEQTVLIQKDADE